MLLLPELTFFGAEMFQLQGTFLIGLEKIYAKSLTNMFDSVCNA